MSNSTEAQSSCLKISEDVIVQIVELAVAENPDIIKLAGSRVRFVNMFSRSNASSAITIKIKEGAADITVCVTSHFNCNIKKTSESLQRRIKDDVQNMTEIAVSKVNIVITGIFFDENTV